MAIKRKHIPDPELDLIPIMNLVTILIPFLLMAAEFVSLSVIDSTLPAIGPPVPVEEVPEKPPLTLSLAITDQGITVLGADAVLNPGGAAPAAAAEGEQAERPPTVPCKSGTCAGVDDYDWPELQRILGLIKDEYPDDENVIIVPENDLRYEIIVKAMDVSREDAQNKAADGTNRVLFPFVVIAGGAM